MVSDRAFMFLIYMYIPWGKTFSNKVKVIGFFEKWPGGGGISVSQTQPAKLE